MRKRPHPRFVCALLGIAWLVCWGPSVVSALAMVSQELDENGSSSTADANGEVAKALRSMGSLPWYDAEKDSVDPVDVEPRFDDSINRDSRWVPKPDKPQASPPPTTQQTTTAPTTVNPFWLWITTNLGKALAWLALILGMCGLVALLVYAVMKMEPLPDQAGGMQSINSLAPSEEELKKLEYLPVEMKHGQGNLLARADHLYEAGRFDEALIYLYGHRLLMLDRCHAIRLARGKTNHQYLRELRSRLDLRALMTPTVDHFERSFFGRYRISKDDFDTLRNAQPEFDALIASQREAA